MRPRRDFRQEECGAAMVEATIAMTLLLTLTLGFVDFGYALYQWNAATKAVEVGARAASISNPVSDALASAAVTANVALVGTAMASGSFPTYSCTGAGGCTGFNQANFDAIYNRMVVFFPRLQPANVRITYSATGLGYWGRPGGPVPTVTVSLEGLTFQFFFLSGLLGFNDITMPSMMSTVTGEDMKSTYP
ncbi:MAG: pilus assembly protein [Mesorhizobium sp.]|nr:MAG: pilus assembly protein [Mesorhizobium sp.]RWM85263.1 MAG: pilus assembly protein [Mesorhizobium sp.]